MRKAEAIATLKTAEPAARARGVVSLHLFGSMGRDQAILGSDVDVFVDYDPESRFSLVDLVAVKLLLEERLGRPVDVATRQGLHPRMRGAIEREATRVF